jgi:hypothetical protein
MATSKNQISFQSAPGDQTKVIFDRKGNAISLSKTELGLFSGFSGDYRDTVVPSEIVTTIGAAFFAKGSPLANATSTAIPESNSYAPSEDFRVEYDLYLQNSNLGLNGLTSDPRSGSTSGINGHGLYLYDETVEQSDIAPTIVIAGAGGPDYDTDRKKFGVSSLRCKTEGGFKVPHTALTGGIAMEAWFLFLGGTPTTGHNIFAKGEDPAVAGGGETLEWRYFSSAAGVAGVTEGMYFGLNGVNIFAAPATALTADYWHHVAVAITPNQATKIKTFFNGTQVGSYTSGVTLYNYSNSPISVGTDSTGWSDALWKGWIDDVVIKAGGGETTGYMARYTGTTFGVPTASADFDEYVKYHFTFDGTQSGQLFNVRTANSTFAQIAKAEDTSILRVRKTRNYGSSTGFTTGVSGAYIHGMASGAMYPLSYVVDLGITLSTVQQIEAGEQTNDFLETMQTVISSASGYFPYLLGTSSGNSVTGPARSGISGEFGLSGGPTYGSFTFIPSKENINYVSTFMSAINANFIPRTSTTTYPVADSEGNMKYFTVPDMMNLFKDLMRIYTGNEGIIGGNNNYIKTSATKSAVAKVKPFGSSATSGGLTLDVGENGTLEGTISPPALSLTYP